MSKMVELVLDTLLHFLDEPERNVQLIRVTIQAANTLLGVEDPIMFLGRVLEYLRSHSIELVHLYI